MAFGELTKGTIRAAAAALACAAAISGCGDDSDDEPGDPQTTTPASREQHEPASALRTEFERRVTELLTDRGLDPEVTECALDELAESIPESELRSAIAEIRNTGAAPPGVIEAAAAAGETCGRS